MFWSIAPSSGLGDLIGSDEEEEEDQGAAAAAGRGGAGAAAGTSSGVVVCDYFSPHPHTEVSTHSGVPGTAYTARLVI